MEGANGDLVKRWATLPFLVSQPALPGAENPDWLAAQPYSYGFHFLFYSGNIPELLLLQGRAMIVLLGIATGLLVFYCSREVFGPVGGVAALALFALSPDMLAFGGLVSTDMSICLMMLGAIWCIWRLLHRITWGRLLAAGVVLPLLFLAKATAMAIFPITAALVAVRLFSGRPLEWRLGRRRTIQSRLEQAKMFFALLVIFGLWCWAGLWAHYDFRYASSPNTADPRIQAWVHTPKNPMNPVLQSFIFWSRREHLFPEGYLDGMELTLTDNETRESFMNGQWIVGGSRAFFPYAIWAKTSPALLLLLILGMGCWWWKRRREPAAENNSGTPAGVAFSPLFYELSPYVILITVFLAVAMAQDLNVAHRYILPIYPPIEILAGGGVGLLWAGRRKWAQVAALLLMLGYAGETWAIYPNYLAYFSPVVGGPSQGYKRLVESSLDWGMDLPDLKTWLDQHNPQQQQKFYFAYFGTDSPDYYGIQSTRLPSYPMWEKEGHYDLAPGIYAISATLFQSFYTATRGPWNEAFENHYQNCLKNLRIYEAIAKDPVQLAVLLKKFPRTFWLSEYGDFKQLRFGRLCTWLRHHRDPDDNVDHTILIWHLNQTEIDAALYGPPDEMAPAPLWIAPTTETVSK
jgi:hypothetical protein